jgi:hypothetical protein
MWEEPGTPGLGDDGLEEDDDEEEEEAEVGGSAIPLEGTQLGGTTEGEEHSADLARATFGGTLWMLFTPMGPSDQPALMPLKLSERPSQSSKGF